MFCLLVSFPTNTVSWLVGVQIKVVIATSDLWLFIHASNLLSLNSPPPYKKNPKPPPPPKKKKKKNSPPKPPNNQPTKQTKTPKTTRRNIKKNNDNKNIKTTTTIPPPKTTKTTTTTTKNTPKTHQNNNPQITNKQNKKQNETLPEGPCKIFWNRLNILGTLGSGSSRLTQWHQRGLKNCKNTAEAERTRELRTPKSWCVFTYTHMSASHFEEPCMPGLDLPAIPEHAASSPLRNRMYKGVN